VEPWNVGLSRKQWRCGDVGVANSVCVQGHGFGDFGAVQLTVMYHNPDITIALQSCLLIHLQFSTLIALYSILRNRPRWYAAIISMEPIAQIAAQAILVLRLITV